ncbi:hypothetical protein QNH05_gp40 [Escherichia phage vB_EcoM_DE15]|uniref:Uncharacterized protein n=1 Tax=Escherichia phage vB_EcoM_DE15 TaxID=3003366 RepID=A0AAE9VK92_9CAUD|nr:hypothetical protein QNH05_gp40 [Escherichia phage vB_EcoM_DE15]WAX24555.1 hypothetical protein [Escherichia phage vB_EcoM_DE15]
MFSDTVLGSDYLNFLAFNARQQFQLLCPEQLAGLFELESCFQTHGLTPSSQQVARVSLFKVAHSLDFGCRHLGQSFTPPTS